MKVPIEDSFSILGLQLWGDIGPFTVFRNKRGEVIWYLKAPPTKPASALQKIYRDRWRAAAIQWQALTKKKQQRWELASKRASLGITGYNLFLYWRTTSDDLAIRTIERQTGFELLE